MSKTYEEIVAQLDAKIPRDAIAKREAGNGKKLDYLEGWYVIARLNEVFGQGNWAYGIRALEKRFDGVVKNFKGEESFYASYTATIQLVVEFPDGLKTEFVEVGFGDGQDKLNPGKVHELATKEAVTDGLKRCAKNLGMSMGLALYDKSQENVDDGQEAAASKPAPAVKKGPQAAKESPVAQAVQPSSIEEARSRKGSNQAPADRKALNDAIAGISQAILNRLDGPSQQKRLKQMRDEMQAKYGTSRKEELTDQQAAEFYESLKGEVA